MAERFVLSREQSAAVKSFGGDLGVSAGAGSGKTTVLVERYLEAVTEKGARLPGGQAWPENILAVTFTDKAANVMKERLRRRCSERGLHELGRRLDNAWIGTIHSFCARFLKENPIECAVDPLFTVLGKGEQEMLMEEVLDRLFEEEASNELCLRLLADFGEDSLRSNLKFFYDKKRSSLDTGDILRVETKEKEGADCEKKLKEALRREISEEAKPGGPEEKLKDACSCALAVLEQQADVWKRRRGVLEALAVLQERSPKTKEKVKALKATAEAWAALQLQRLSVPLKGEWRRLVTRFSDTYENEKRRLGAHDFDDLLDFTYRALSGTSAEKKALRRRAQERFAYVFVDEYQDTSLLQAGIIGLIARGDNLFMVGDVRQSIYRFRHAHPEIFLEALKRSKAMALAENYRSRPEILDFVNGIFTGLFGASHKPLRAKRKFTLKKDHCLEWIAVPKDERRLEVLRVIEARTIAARVRKLVDSGFEVEEKGGKRPVRWNDFAILMRKTTASHLYEKELEEAGIPHFVNKGKGFYEQTEVSDLVNFLRALENPSENLAMAAVLRSPLVQLSDDALYWLSAERLKRGGDEALSSVLARHGDVAELSPEDRAKIGIFLPLLERLRAQKDRMKLSELLHAVVDQTAYEAKLLTRPEGPQAAANIWKLIEMASSVEDKSVRGISDFILYLKSISDSSETESEARVVGEEENVLRILTVHAAKGLEFPCVVLADLGGREEGQSSRPPFLASASQGLGARLKDPESFESCDDAAYQAIVEEEGRKEAEESDRLLYVAMTRAKEHLILSGVQQGERMRFLESALAGYPFYRVPIVSKRAWTTPPVTARTPRAAGADKAAVSKLADELTDPKKLYESLEDLTVTRLVEAAKTPLAYRTGSEMPLPYPVRSVETEDEEDATPRNEFGTMFHLLMELSSRHAPRGELAADRFKALTAGITLSEKKEIEEGFLRFWNSVLGKAVKASKRCYPELPFIYKTRHGLLKGQMDLVFEDKEGGWAIVDYKTNRFASPTEEAAAVEIYRPQMGLYALAFWRLYGEIPKRTVLYFMAGDKTVEIVWSESELTALSLRLEEWYRKALAF